MQEAPSAALLELGVELGLATSYVDFWGQHRELDRSTLCDLLRAMGISLDFGDEPALRDALDHLRADKAANALTPVRVIRQSKHEPLHVGTDLGAQTWCLMHEDGGLWEGRIAGDAIHWPDEPPTGYHRLLLTDADGAAVVDTTLIVCPPRCFQAEALRSGQRWWGPTVQLYGLRSERNWGMGDFSDLSQVIDMAARQGAAFVGLNPLHALFPHDPEWASPYSPSSRAMLNTMYIDVEAVAEFDACELANERVRHPAFQRRLQALREAHHIDYAGVAAAKSEILNLLYAHFRRHHLDRNDTRGIHFHAFQQQGGQALRRYALFDALQQHNHAVDPNAWGWTTWPHRFQDAYGPDAAAFAQEHLIDVEYAEYLQWLAHLQLEAARQKALSRGMPIGLYLDVAVGVNEGGADTWTQPDLYALDVHVGAPQEEFSPCGQDWGLPPINPSKLRASLYQPFINMLRANMRHAGALRLDHVMSLRRLFWVPPCGGPASGTYMHYPMDDLVGILALESVRHRCLIIGEDLGTVPPGFRPYMLERGVLSYCPLYFERDDHGSFRPPEQWKPQALAVVGTHDLPTLRAWWRGDDIETRARLGLFPTDEQRRQQVIDRANERVQLLLLLEAQGLLPQGSSINPAAIDDGDPRFTEAVYTLLGRSQACLAGVQFEDVVQQLEQVNVPSTTEAQHPNWRVKLTTTLDDLQHDSRWLTVCQALRQSRPRADMQTEGDAGLAPLSTALIPRATYRLQLNATMPFTQATQAVPYLARLGISHLYASPYLKARAGSTHGYDIVDHNALNPEIGGANEHEALCAALREHHMHQLIDIVPNHMGVLEADNAWWLDVLECGAASVHAATFDIEWTPAAPELQGKVLLPVLGDHYGRILEAGELKLEFDSAEGGFALRYHGHRFPIDPRSYAEVFAAAPQPAAELENGDADRAEVLSLIDSFARLPDRDDAAPDSRALRQRDKRLLKRHLADAYACHPWLGQWVNAALDAFNGSDGNAGHFDALDRLLDKQAYRLAFWRVAGDDVNYRRFFDVNTLAALRMENTEVFDATHRTVMRWLAEGCVSGLRIDHPDGLSDPRAYCMCLQERYAQARLTRGLPARALYIVVEKILAEHERVPDDWPVHGGTGYRFATMINGLHIDSTREADMDAAYTDFIGYQPQFDHILRESKLLIMSTSLASDLQLLTEALHRIGQSDRCSRDFTRNRLRAALTEVAAGFPVYRSYISELGVSQTDRRHVAWACAEAKRRSHAFDVNAIDYLHDILLNAPDEPDAERRIAMLAFVRRWQQFSAAVMAKAMEDTAFYRYPRLLSLNDVGGDPRRFGVSVAAFHAATTARARYYPHAMLGTSTHDSKRSEDVRARLNVLSEMPQAWSEAIQRWRTMNRSRAESAEAEVCAEDEYLIYQTLVGIWPLTPLTQEGVDDLRQRVQDYMLKALREAKSRTSWINPHLDYEAAVSRFVNKLLGTLEPNPFLKDLQAFVAPIANLGCLNSLNQVVLKLTAPGVPDIYQGCETWKFTLVDPDNRRPVDFAQRQALLTDVQEAFGSGPIPPSTLQTWLTSPAPGHLKMLLTWRLLALRRLVPDLFEKGSYRPLDAHGQASNHVVAYMRREEAQPERSCVVITSRLPHGLQNTGEAHGPYSIDHSVWGHASISWTASGITQWADWLTGHRLNELLAKDPAAPNEWEASMDALTSALPMAVLVPAHWLDLPFHDEQGAQTPGTSPSPHPNAPPR